MLYIGLEKPSWTDLEIDCGGGAYPTTFEGRER